MDRLFVIIGAIGYLVAFAIALGALRVRERPPRAWIMTAIGAGFLFQTIGLHLRGFAVGACPIGNPYEVLQFISWSIILVYLLAGPIFRLSLLGSVSATLAALLSVLGLIVPGWDHPTPGKLFGDPWIEMHAALALMSYGIFGLLAVTSGLYLAQNYGLKSKRFSVLLRLFPSLVELESVNFRLLVIGCGMFSCALVIGSVYWLNNWGDTSVPKLIITVALWSAYLAVLVLRLGQKLVGFSLSVACLSLFVGALLALWPVEADRVQSHPQAVPADVAHHG
ncbi:MAG: cytochrome c biogenesis protein CcsA [Verrucomicrobiota bacterium JB022]|nr:cytochrome c biogenesis protein CcsA [Verrucomicrobiota bacterium JB022]